MKPSHRPSILLIEDDPSLALGVSDALEFEGFQVTHAQSGDAGLDRAVRNPPDCVILDLMLPDTNGYTICEELRRHDSTIPIVMLTARSQEADKIRGFNVGADDYVTKPFSVSELVARIHAVLRRARPSSGSASLKSFSFGEVSVDPRTQSAKVGERSHSLSFYELELLRLLYANEGRPVTRDDILKEVWGSDAAVSSRTIDNTIVKLRKKIEPSPQEPQHLLTVYGVGYKLIR